MAQFHSSLWFKNSLYFLHSPVDGHRAQSHNLAIVSSATANSPVHVSLCCTSLFKGMPFSTQENLDSFLSSVHVGMGLSFLKQQSGKGKGDMAKSIQFRVLR